MYQWVEEEIIKERSNHAGTVTKTKEYIYKEQWSENEIYSGNFKEPGHNNPPFKLKSEKFYAQRANLGAFNLTQLQKRRLTSMTPIYNLPAIRGYSTDGGYYYPYSNRSNNSVGAIRISYSYVPSGTNISIIGKQNSDNTIDEMPTDKGELYIQYDGKMTLQEMLEKFRQTNFTVVWMNRLIGFFIMAAGLYAITMPIRFFAGFFRGAGIIVSLLNRVIVFVIAAVLSLCTIGIAWFAYRPELTFSVIGGALIIFGIIFLIKKKYDEQN